MPKKKWLRMVPLYDDDPEILSNLASNTKVCTKAFRFLCVGESHLAKGTECNCTQRPCKRAVSCTVWMCHRDTPWSARWLPLSQRLLCFHSCYSNKTIAVADGQQYPPLWSSRQEKGGGYFAANIQDRWQSDSRLSLSHWKSSLHLQSILFTVRQLKAHFLCLAYSTLKLTALFLSEYMRTMINQLSLVKYDINIIYISR